MHVEEKSRLEAERRLAEERAVKAEKEKTRAAKRVHNGICPDCNRSFVDLGRHMKSKHSPKCEVVKLHG